TTLPRYSGTYIVSVRPIDSVDYSGSYSGTLIIAKGVASYTWNIAVDTITYGTALGNNQLDAVFSKAGTSSYNPISGTVLSSGIQPITLNWTPADTNLLPITSII